MPKQAEWAQFYLNYHEALIADVLDRPQDARRRLRALDAAGRDARCALRSPTPGTRPATATTSSRKEILDGQTERSQGEPHVLVRELQQAIGPGKKTDLLISTPAEGMAEVFYGLGEALTSEGGVSMGVLYLQLALYSKPDHAFALAALASAYESGQRYEEAIDAYDRIPPGSALQGAIDIRKAFDLNSLEKADEAQGDPRPSWPSENPTDLKPLDALGNIMRARKRYAEAVDFYTARHRAHRQARQAALEHTSTRAAPATSA